MSDQLALEAMACNCSGLRKAARRVSLLYDRYLARSGLTIGQYAILAEIARSPEGEPPTLTRLARGLVMDRTALSHTLRPLIREGLVRFGRDHRDRRAKLVYLTPRGHRRAAVARSCWVEAQTRFSAAFGEDQAVALRALLRMVTDAELDEPQP